jgi:gentisate 1,2-dioxygenase
LRHYAAHSDTGLVELDYINPETGASCLPTLGFTATMLRSGQIARPQLRSSSAVFHAISGKGHSLVNGQRIDWRDKSTFSAPVFAAIDHRADGGEPAFLIRIHDAPLQERMGFYEERGR